MPKRPVKRERAMLSEFGSSLSERGAFWFKIPDMPHFEGAKFRFDLGKPFDGFGAFAGQAFVIEAKVVPTFKAITPKLFRPVQIQGLDAWVKTGGRAFVAVYIREDEQRAAAKAGKPIRRLVFIDWAKFARLDGYVLSKAELAAMPWAPRYGVKTESGNKAYRFNVDEWLIDLIMN